MAAGPGDILREYIGMHLDFYIVLFLQALYLLVFGCSLICPIFQAGLCDIPEALYFVLQVPQQSGLT